MQVNAAPAAPPARPRVTTVLLSVMTTLPPASSTETTGCWASALPAVAVLLGSVVYTSCVAGPYVMLNELLAGAVNPSPLAPRV